jgi:FdhE protein
LLRKRDFVVDLDTAAQLFQSLCQIAAKANPFLAGQAGRIEENLKAGKLDLKKLLRDGLNDQKTPEAVEALGLDENVLSFLIRNSLRPFILAAMKRLSRNLEPASSFGRDCPVCGSLAELTLLDEEAGKKSGLCSFCGYRWRIERLFCLFCGNQEQDSLHYLFAEEDDSCRIDLCEKCRRYIKTVDLRKTAGRDPMIEDLATLHLDLLAFQRGFERTAPSPWIRSKARGEERKVEA